MNHEPSPLPLAEFYATYAAACRELGIAPLSPQELLALVKLLADRVNATVQ